VPFSEYHSIRQEFVREKNKSSIFPALQAGKMGKYFPLSPEKN
jgi:hypothetical protein